ncbi:MAG: hypothetical protein ABGZ24_23195, partial [Fuerstiella sp.]
MYTICPCLREGYYMNVRHLLQIPQWHLVTVTFCLTVFGFLFSAPLLAAEKIADEWRYTLRRPA